MLPDSQCKTPQGTPYRIKASCRLCGGPLRKILDLGETPLANELLDSAEASLAQERFPLFLSQCEGCDHVQMPVVVDPERLFRHYPYVSGTSPAFVKHLRAMAAELVGGLPLAAGDLVVEVGSNDGTLLAEFQRRGCRVVGVDPARNVAEIAEAAGVPTVAEFFTHGLARRLEADHGRARLVVANNVFAHAEDLSGIVRGVESLLADDGVFVFEVGYLLDMVETGAFDLVYHEHLSFHHVAPLRPFFARHGLEVVGYDRVPTQGGSVRVYVARPGGKREWMPKVPEPAVVDVARFVENAKKAIERIAAFAEVLHDDTGGSNEVMAFGAPAKLCTLAACCGIGNDWHASPRFVADDNPLKHGKFVPGTNIEIVSPQRLLELDPPFVWLFAWNFAAPIIKASGDVPWHWVVPLPELRIV